MALLRLAPSGVFVSAAGAPTTGVYWVDAAATSTPDGSSGAPFPTLQAAHDAVPAGSTLLVAPGVYAGAELTKSLTLRGLGGTAAAVTIGDVSAEGLLASSDVLALVFELVSVEAVAVEVESSVTAVVSVRASRVGALAVDGGGLCAVDFGGWATAFGLSGDAAVCTGTLALQTDGSAQLSALNARFQGSVLVENGEVRCSGCQFLNGLTCAAAIVQASYIQELTGNGFGYLEIDDASWLQVQFLTGFEPVRVFSGVRTYGADLTIPAMTPNSAVNVFAVVPELADAALAPNYEHGLAVSFSHPVALPLLPIGFLGAWRETPSTGEIGVRVVNPGSAPFAGSFVRALVSLVRLRGTL